MTTILIDRIIEKMVIEGALGGVLIQYRVVMPKPRARALGHALVKSVSHLCAVPTALAASPADAS